MHNAQHRLGSIHNHLVANGVVGASSSTFANGGLVLRPLSIKDYDMGYLQVLSELTSVGTISRDNWTKRFQQMQATPDHYHTMVIEDVACKKIIAAATLFIELKLSHGLSRLANVEDVVVNGTYRGQQLGIRVVQALIDIAKSKRCNKIVLDCSLANESFYHRLGFVCHQDSQQLSLYFD